MEIIRIKSDDGGEEKCVIRCEEHNYFYNAFPPETQGCQSCWMTYYMGQRAQMPAAKQDAGLDELETAITHMRELILAGGWDLKLLDHPEIEIEHKDDN